MNDTEPLDRICFVISPIGRDATPTYEKFKEVLDFVIKPAVQNAAAHLKVVRAYEIEKPGSFILKRDKAVERKSELVPNAETARVRLNRILKILGASEQPLGGRFKSGDEAFKIPYSQGEFYLYYVLDGESIRQKLYIAAPHKVNIATCLADARVLMEACGRAKTECTFVIVTLDSLSSSLAQVAADFKQLKSFVKHDSVAACTLEVWDQDRLLAKEVELGIKIASPTKPRKNEGRLTHR